MVKESVIYQDILLKGWRQGWQEGWQKRREIWIKHLLKRSLIENDASVLARIRGLSLEQLEMLLEFSEAVDVKAWLEQQAEGGSKPLSDEDISQQRRIEGEVTWIREKLKERLGEIDVRAIERLRELSLEQLEALSEDFLTFPRAEDAVAWLEQQVEVGSVPFIYQDILQGLSQQGR